MATPAKTSDQLRSGIDHGRGDKVRFSDPAASPLGTDDEAAGAPPPDAAIRQAAKQELRPASPADGRKTGESERSISGQEAAQTPWPWRIAIGIGVAALVAIAVIAVMTA